MDYRMREAADLLGVSDDTLRRWAEGGRLETQVDESNRRVVPGAELARFAQEMHADGTMAQVAPASASSARNHFRGVVTRVVVDTVMAQVEIQAGPFRVVSLISAEAAQELALEPGALAVARVKATNVAVEVPQR